MNGSTATANLRTRRTLFFYVSYGVLTQFLRMNVILTYFATETATATGTERWKSGISKGGLGRLAPCQVGGERRERGTKSQRGGEGKMEWKGGRVRGL